MAAASDGSIRRAEGEKTQAVRGLEKAAGAAEVEAGGDAGRVSMHAAAREEHRQAVVNALERRMFYMPSFKIYGGVAGLCDYGPYGADVKANVLALWCQHFVLEEMMLMVDCPCVTPEVVLRASGHVDNFADLKVRDDKTGACYRVDHLLKDFCTQKLEKGTASLSPEKAAEFKRVLAVLDDLSAEELGAKLREHGVVAPDTKNRLSDPYPFNRTAVARRQGGVMQRLKMGGCNCTSDSEAAPRRGRETALREIEECVSKHISKKNSLIKSKLQDWKITQGPSSSYFQDSSPIFIY